MSCLSGRSPTPLELYAASLAVDAPWQPATCVSEPEAAPMLYPMYVISAEHLLQMTRLEPHEALKDRSDSRV